ncbi:hypothetical protein EDD37DRAFT_653780 [Exophiala viscosa]|uniref:BTB domain-containing protein n=1 Tax=Exophiala viscosa TaxID=2486360 RepID=A0AAN6DQ85_9EURO|nr:hypothetical protein EDD36DRAFT_468199 [Exophiala viscosa]KAI1620724.1 hypothetical protein EDD37DRAFT_653780 [Exophiala viscosa]
MDGPPWLDAEDDPLVRLVAQDISVPLGHFDVAHLTSPIITLEAGPDATPLTAHKAILTRCSYFAKCLDDRFEEGINNKIKLPQESPEDLLKLLSWLYTGKLYAGDREDMQIVELRSEPTTMAVMDLINLFIIADKYCCDRMAAKVLEIVGDSDCIGPEEVSVCHLERVYDADLRGSLLWQVLMEKLARGFHRADQRFDVLSLYGKGLDAKPDIASDLLMEIARIVKEEPLVACCKDQRENSNIQVCKHG